MILAAIEDIPGGLLPPASSLFAFVVRMCLKEEIEQVIDLDLGLSLPLTEVGTSAKEGRKLRWQLLLFLPSLKVDGKIPIPDACRLCFKWLTINIPINKNN